MVARGRIWRMMSFQDRFWFKARSVPTQLLLRRRELRSGGRLLAR